MATRSNIAMKNDQGMFDTIYCHFDGHPTHNGKILLENYQDENLIKELISLGDLESLGERVHPEGEHSYNEPEDGVCVFYGRDRNDFGTECWVAETPEDCAEQAYAYIFMDGAWYWFNNDEDLVLLTPADCVISRID